MPAYIYGEGEPYRPEVLFFIIPDGPVLGMLLAKPGELLPQAAAQLAATIREPMAGPAHAPARIRVASADLARALQPALPPGAELVLAPTPELDEVLESFAKHLESEGENDVPSYLTNDVSKEAVASFFRATARLYRAGPWDLVPSDQDILSISIEALGIRDGVICVIGQTGQAFGLLLFDTLAEFEAYVIEAEVRDPSEKAPPNFPRHLVVSFDNGADLHPALRKEVASHHFEVARASAFPQLYVLDRDLVTRPPTQAEYARAEASVLALAEVLGDKRALLAAFDEDQQPLDRTLSVVSHAGEMTVTIRAPFPQPERKLGAEKGPLAEIAKLDVDDDSTEEDSFIELEAEILKRFAASPEGRGVESTHFPKGIMEFARNYLGTSIAWLRAPELGEILFEIAPRKMVIDVSMLPAVAAECRAFFAYLKRDLGFSQADGCLRLLSGNLEGKLAEVFSDSSQFGIAKALMMAGKNAGFDIESEEGLRAWMHEIEGKPLPPEIVLPGFPPAPALPGTFPKPRRGEATRAKSQKRRTRQKARKKSRGRK